MQAKSGWYRYSTVLVTPSDSRAVPTRVGRTGSNHRLVRILGGFGGKVMVGGETGEQHSEGEGANNDFHRGYYLSSREKCVSQGRLTLSTLR